MTKLTKNTQNVIKGIHKFNDEIKTNPQLQDRLSRTRAWYAVKNENGTWSLGASKFIGYQGLNAEEYLKNSQNLDGRKTELHLSKWFTEVTDDELSEILWDKLAELLEPYGKEPNSAVRFSILDKDWDEQLTADGAEHQQRKIIELIIEISKTLSAENLKQLKLKLAGQ
ncbi:MAG: hypothetical protein COC24_010160 [Alphaproteobacteria bacterium]|nr:hypothetical protein [Alphaproteobacteria bacterium]